ncbi:MAG: cation:dicarboxylase symporter family transporter [Halieaceae bacterium]|jgi:Na+/H+-dicarboxylate symporter|nr:cation:dicarboxylase symporter family transporter [Halieaceae bacterium]
MTGTLSLWSQASLSTRILAGLGLGILTGLFLGEPAAALQPVADIYIRLMQMTVLPYLITSLIIAFGQLSAAEATRLMIRGGVLLLVVWALTCAVIVLLPMAFPDIVTASFFSHSMVEPHQPFSFTEIYFTSNPFDSLARNIVPAVVLFSSAMGLGLIGVQGKEQLLAPMRTLNAAILRVTGFIVHLTPVGVFAIGAVTAGTMLPDTLSRLEAYFIVFSGASLLLAFWILPLLVTAVTPFRYREVTGIARAALLTAFVTNSAFIVLPILIERSKELLSNHGLLDENTESSTEVLVPIMFNFPNAGKLLTLLFLPFAAWLSGAPMPPGDYGQLFAAGIPSYFAKAQVALPFLLDLLGMPQDLFQLYIPTTIITGKFDSLVTAMNLLVFALLGAAATGGFIVFQRARILRALLAIAGGTAVVVILTRLLLALVIDTSYTMDQAVQAMHRSQLAPDTIVHRQAVAGDAAAYAGLTPLERIRARGSLRIGYDPDNLPMSFFNTDDELVGFDVEVAEQLALALAVRAEFIPVQWAELPRLLAEGVIDVMPGMWYRPYWFSSLRLSQPYFTVTMGFAVRDERRREFSSLESLRSSRGLKVAVPLDQRQISTSMRHYFAGTDTEFVTFDVWRPFFEGKHPEIDAFLMPAEHAAARSLLYPQYTAVVPLPDPVEVPTAFGLARDAGELLEVVDEWVLFAEKAGLNQPPYDYWILGQGAKQPEPRWSVMRNVLGWVP